MSKPELRKKLASLSFSEKIKILEKLRRRSLAIAAAGLRAERPEPDAKYSNSDRVGRRSRIPRLRVVPEALRPLPKPLRA